MVIKRITATLISLLIIGITLVPLRLSAQNQSGITSPNNGDGVSGDVIITGTAVIEPFLRYELYYKQEPNSDDAFIYFDGGTAQVANGQLGIWRTSDLAPGNYSLRLRVVKADGNYGEFVITGLRLNVNQEPTVTPTSSEPTPTPIPTATFIPAPQPTAIVGQVAQPQIEGQAPFASPTPVLSLNNLGDNGAGGTDAGGTNAGGTNAGSNGEAGTSDSGTSSGDAIVFAEGNAPSTAAATTNNFTRQLGEAVALDRLREYFVTGMRFSALLILGIMILFAGKWAFRWVWTQYR